MAKQSISIEEFLFGENLISLSITLILLFLGIIVIMVFIQKLIFLKRENKVDPDLLKNVNDLLNDGRIEAAIDLCKSDNSAESRSVEKGLARLGRPVNEIVSAMETHSQVELNKAEKNINYLATISGTAPMLGLLGSILILAFTFGGISKAENLVAQNLLAADFYQALTPSVVGLLVGFLSYIFHNILVAKVDRLLMKIQYHTNEFLDIINNPA